MVAFKAPPPACHSSKRAALRQTFPDQSERQVMALANLQLLARSLTSNLNWGYFKWSIWNKEQRYSNFLQKALYGTSKVNVLVSSYVLGCNLDSILYVKKSRSKPCYESSIAAFRSFRYLCWSSPYTLAFSCGECHDSESQRSSDQFWNSR